MTLSSGDYTDDSPIYSLCDYQSQGSLLKLVRKILVYDQEEENKSYRDEKYHKQRKKDNKMDENLKLHSSLKWWQLIKESDGEERLSIDSFKVKIISICHDINKLLRPYLYIADDQSSLPFDSISGLLSTSGQQVLKESRVLACKKQHILSHARNYTKSTTDGPDVALTSAAALRRISWQRRSTRPNVDEKTSNLTFSVSSDDDRIMKKWAPLVSWLREAHLEPNPALIWSKLTRHRGKYGESLIHILIVSQSNEHLILLVLILYLWPSLVMDIFESNKLAGLGCLHLAIAYQNESLLSFLIEHANCNHLTKQVVEQRISGSLFRLPESLMSSKNQEKCHRQGEKNNNKNNGQSFCRRWPPKTRTKISASISETEHLNMGRDKQTYWCDQAQRWPSASGHNHLLLLDRLRGGNGVDGKQPVYLGITPLAWSVSFGQRSQYEQLVHNGEAEQNSCDEYGNTCLHLVVLNNLTGWTRFLVKSGAKSDLKDSDGFTPFLLTCRLGRYELFEELLELSASEFWSYSMIRCCGYPLTQLDSLVVSSPGEAAVSVILESKDSNNEQKAQLLSCDVVKKLLEEKWNLFARKLFLREFSLALVHLALMTIAISLRTSRLDRQLNVNENPIESNSATSYDQQQMFRHLAELVTLIMSTCELLRFMRLWLRYGNVTLQWTYNPMLPNLVTGNALIVCCALVRTLNILANIYQNYHKQADRNSSRNQYAGSSIDSILMNIELVKIEDVLLIFAAPLLWSSLLFFIAAFRVTGPFVAMIKYMIVRDLRQFSLIYLVFVSSFAQCIFFINYQPQQPATVGDPRLFNFTSSSDNLKMSSKIGDHLLDLSSSYSSLWMELFHMTLGVYNLQPYRHSTLARFFFLLFIYLIPILFNMLIAMMNNTYSLIISQSERAWSFQWARTLFALEQTLSESDKSAQLKLYSINMVAPDPPLKDENSDSKGDTGDAKDETNKEESPPGKRFVPALMIIKRMNFTRAERRRLVVGYWQKAIRSILDRRMTNRGSPLV